MKRALIAVTLVALLVFGSGCASTKQFVAFPDQTKIVANADMGRVYVLRPTMIGSGVSMKIMDGQKLIGSTGPNGYLCWEREPGATEISGKAENTSKIPLTVEKGKVYYIGQHLRMGLLFARNKLELLTEEDGKRKLVGCKPPTVVQK